MILILIYDFDLKRFSAHDLWFQSHCFFNNFHQKVRLFGLP